MLLFSFLTRNKQANKKYDQKFKTTGRKQQKHCPNKNDEI